MKTSQLFLASFLGALIGCVANQALQSSRVTAQAGELRECVIYPLSHDRDLEDLPENAQPITGWTPVGGSNEGVVLCR